MLWHKKTFIQHFKSEKNTAFHHFIEVAIHVGIINANFNIALLGWWDYGYLFFRLFPQKMRFHNSNFWRSEFIFVSRPRKSPVQNASAEFNPVTFTNVRIGRYMQITESLGTTNSKSLVPVTFFSITHLEGGKGRGRPLWLGYQSKPVSLPTSPQAALHKKSRATSTGPWQHFPLPSRGSSGSHLRTNVASPFHAACWLPRPASAWHPAGWGPCNKLTGAAPAHQHILVTGKMDASLHVIKLKNWFPDICWLRGS